MALGWVLLCSLWVWGGRVAPTAGHSLFSCEPIILRMCQDLPYNTTFMPNLLNHYDQQTAALAMEVNLFFFSHKNVFIYLISAFSAPIIDKRIQKGKKKENQNIE